MVDVGGVNVDLKDGKWSANGAADVGVNGGNWSADRVASGDPTSLGYGGTVQGILDNVGVDVNASEIMSTSKLQTLKDTLTSGLRGLATGGILSAIISGITGAKQSGINQVASNLVAAGYDASEAKTLASNLVNSVASSSYGSSINSDHIASGGAPNGSYDEIINNAIDDTLQSYASDLSSESSAEQTKSSQMKSIYNNFLDTWDGESPIGKYESPLDVYNASEQYTADAVDAFTNTTNQATGTQKTLLDGLISDAQEGTGYFSPFSFKVGGQDVSFVPKMNRETASLLSDFGQQSFDNSTNSADKVLAATLLANPTTGEQTWLDKLTEIAKQTSDEDYRQEALDKGYTVDMANVDINQQQVDQDEPGLLDYLKGGTSLLSSINDIFDIF